MFKAVTAILVALLVVHGVESKSNRPDPVFLGRAITQGVRADGTKYQKQSEYYVEIVPNSWTGALQRCRTVGYDCLVEIETEDEWAYIIRLLEPYGPGQCYWMAAEYSTTGGWQWDCNGLALPSWAPWGTGHPINDIVHKGAICYNTSVDVFWQTYQLPELHSFICEKSTPLETEPVPCPKTNDLIVVLDGSGSIGLQNFEIARAFVARLAMAYLEHQDTNVGFILYSTDVTTIFDLGTTMSNTQINDTILSVEYPGGSTNTGEAILSAVEQQLKYQRQVTQNMVVITDGVSNNSTLTKFAALYAQSQDIRTFAVGIGAANPTELLDIAVGNAENVFRTEEFDSLLNLLRSVSLRVCEDF